MDEESNGWNPYSDSNLTSVKTVCTNEQIGIDCSESNWSLLLAIFYSLCRGRGLGSCLNQVMRD